MSAYQPPVSLNPAILALMADISETLGRWSVLDGRLNPHLRRDNRIRTIQASLAIENNTLSVEQVTAVLAGKRVLGLPREIQEVRNAFAAYEQLPNWQPHNTADLLSAHGMLMAGLVDDAGHLRSGGVGIYRGNALVHMPPPASRVPDLLSDLLRWLGRQELHPLLASCVFHYEFEFIHPFADGNGRLGRLWQTLTLSRWQPALAWLPVETVIRDRQADYYVALAQADRAAEATPFVEFMLRALLTAMQEVPTDQVSDQVKVLLRVLAGSAPLKTSEIMQCLGLAHRPSFSRSYLNPALEAGWVERTQPDSPKSPSQRYRLTEIGLQLSRRYVV